LWKKKIREFFSDQDAALGQRRLPLGEGAECVAMRVERGLQQPEEVSGIDGGENHHMHILDLGESYF
jgi:hypothetical protein